MTAWFEEMAGPTLGPVLMWMIIVLVIVALFWPFRGSLRDRLARVMPGASRDRRARLAVLNVAAVDNRRRLVLIRRDDVEHLIMIGGPSDIVIEQNIRRRPASAPRHAAPPVAPAVLAPTVKPQRQPAEPPAVAMPAPAPEIPIPAAGSDGDPDFDRDLFKAIEATLGTIPASPDQPSAEMGPEPALTEIRPERS